MALVTCRRCGHAEEETDLIPSHVVERHVSGERWAPKVTLRDLGRVYLHPSCYSIWQAREGERFELVAEWQERPEPRLLGGAYFCTLCGGLWTLHHPLECQRHPVERTFDYKGGPIQLTFGDWWKRVILCEKQLRKEDDSPIDVSDRAREMWLSSLKPAVAAARLLLLEVPRGL